MGVPFYASQAGRGCGGPQRVLRLGDSGIRPYKSGAE